MGNQPAEDFAPGQYGVVLHVKNTRAETIIIERVDAKPSLLGFAAGDKLLDITVAVVRQRQIPAENPLITLRPKEEAELVVMVFDPFQYAEGGQHIKVTMHWRASSRSFFSKSKVTKKMSVRDIKDLRRAS